ncbi:MAG: hypothetical protein MJ099_01090 [Clostridia bacterium]|nr:hypothetical protein [Clostridia bacterium]
MNNVLLGKTIRAMYKLSGKTLPQLSEETGLTVDSINNLFYARIQKPGLADLCALTAAMGFSVAQLTDFMAQRGSELADSDNVAEAFTLFLSGDSEIQPVAAAETVPVQQHEEKIAAQFREQIELLRMTGDKLEQHYNLCITELRSIHAKEMARQDEIIAQNHRTIRRLRIALIGVVAVFFILSLVDVLNINVGWLR